MMAECSKHQACLFVKLAPFCRKPPGATWSESLPDMRCESTERAALHSTRGQAGCWNRTPSSSVTYKPHHKLQAEMNFPACLSLRCLSWMVRFSWPFGASTKRCRTCTSFVRSCTDNHSQAHSHQDKPYSNGNLLVLNQHNSHALRGLSCLAAQDTMGSAPAGSSPISCCLPPPLLMALCWGTAPHHGAGPTGPTTETRPPPLLPRHSIHHHLNYPVPLQRHLCAAAAACAPTPQAPVPCACGQARPEGAAEHDSTAQTPRPRTPGPGTCQGAQVWT